MPPLIEAFDLTKTYGSTIALESVSFEVHEGVTGLLGPNGAGKSTAIKLFLGLIRPTAGSAEVLGMRPYENVESRAPAWLHARARLPARQRHGLRVPHAHGPGQRTPAGLRPHPSGRHPAPRRARRGALPAHRRVLHRHEAAREARPSLVHDPSSSCSTSPPLASTPAGARRCWTSFRGQAGNSASASCSPPT